MGRSEVSFDAEVFARTASLFAVKRQVFEPDAVAALSNDIVRRLARARPNGFTFDVAEISAVEIAAFCDALVQPEPEAALQFIEARRQEGLTRNGVYLGYIGAAARHLGELWDDNRLNFLQVTYGTGHLYALMRSLRAERVAARPAFDGRRCAMFATVPGEDHGIGITVAADVFREVGWDIDLRTDTDHDDLLAHVERTQPHVIGLSLSTEGRIDGLVRLVVAMRIVMPLAIIGVALGGCLNSKKVRDMVDIDLVFEDARSACVELDRLIWLRA